MKNKETDKPQSITILEKILGVHIRSHVDTVRLTKNCFYFGGGAAAVEVPVSTDR